MLPDKSPGYTYSHEMRSRYGETDKMGYVYYGHYLGYFEEARTEMIRSLGIPYSQLEDEGFMLPVVHAQIDYKAPVHYDELMQVKVHLYDLPSVKLETYYEVYTGRREDAHVTGQVTLCFMDKTSRKPCRAPKHFVDKIISAMNG